MAVDQTPPTGTFPALGTPSARTGTWQATCPSTRPRPTPRAVSRPSSSPTPAASGTVATIASAPFDATWHTGSLADGPYTLSATITDVAGNVTTLSQPVVVDNTAPIASVDDPGAFGHGTIPLSVTATDAGSGVDTRAHRAPDLPPRRGHVDDDRDPGGLDACRRHL